MERGGCIYIMASINNSTLYVGVKSQLQQRVLDHKTKKYPNSFTAKYNCVKLVYYQGFYSIEEAIAAEKRIKGGNRKQKETLINSINIGWRDLWDDISKW
jgi:putative endonuclease